MKFRNLLALMASTFILDLSSMAYADDITGEADPTTGLGASVDNIPLVNLMYDTSKGLYVISASNEGLGSDTERSIIYFGDKQNHVYACDETPHTTAQISITCKQYNGK